MKGYAYTGEKAPLFVPVCVYEGWLDWKKYQPARGPDNLYRYPQWKIAGWWIGNQLAKMF
jgi:hypothetical protein